MSKADEGIKTIIESLQNDWKQKDNESALRYMLNVIKTRIKLEALVKEFNKHTNGVSSFLADKILEDDPTYEVVVDGIKFNPEIKETYSLDKEILGVEKPAWDCPEFFEYLKEQGEDGVIKVKKSVHHKTRNSILDELREKNIDLPEFVKVNFFKQMHYSETAVKKSVS